MKNNEWTINGVQLMGTGSNVHMAGLGLVRYSDDAMRI
jgi:hypothetical protein